MDLRDICRARWRKLIWDLGKNLHRMRDMKLLIALLALFFLALPIVEGYTVINLSGDKVKYITQLPYVIRDPGIYVLSIFKVNPHNQTIVIESDNVVLDGENKFIPRPPIPIPPPDSSCGIIVRNKQNVVIKNTKISNCPIGIVAKNVVNLRIENVEVSYVSNYGIKLENVRKARLLKLSIHHNNHGILVTSSNDILVGYSRIYLNKVKLQGSEPLGIGMDIGDSKNILIEHVNITSNIDGLSITSSRNILVRDIVVKNDYTDFYIYNANFSITYYSYIGETPYTYLLPDTYSVKIDNSYYAMFFLNIIEDGVTVKIENSMNSSFYTQNPVEYEYRDKKYLGFLGNYYPSLQDSGGSSGGGGGSSPSPISYGYSMSRNSRLSDISFWSDMDGNGVHEYLSYDKNGIYDPYPLTDPPDNYIVDGLPIPPYGLRAINRGEYVELSWNMPDGLTINKYHIYRKEGPDPFEPLYSTIDKTYQDTINVTGPHRYCYYVVAEIKFIDNTYVNTTPSNIACNLTGNFHVWGFAVKYNGYFIEDLSFNNVLKINVIWDNVAPKYVYGTLRNKYGEELVLDFKRDPSNKTLWKCTFDMKKLTGTVDPIINITFYFTVETKHGNIYSIVKKTRFRLDVKWVKVPWFNYYSNYDELSVVSKDTWNSTYVVHSIVRAEKYLDVEITLDTKDLPNRLNEFIPVIKKERLVTIPIIIDVDIVFYSRTGDIDVIFLNSRTGHSKIGSTALSKLMNVFSLKTIDKLYQYVSNHPILSKNIEVSKKALNFLYEKLIGSVILGISYSMDKIIIRRNDLRDWRIKIWYRIHGEHSEAYSITQYGIYVEDLLADHFSNQYVIETIIQLFVNLLSSQLTSLLEDIASDVLSDVYQPPIISSNKEPHPILVVYYSYSVNSEPEIIIGPTKYRSKYLWETIPIGLISFKGTLEADIVNGLKIRYVEARKTESIITYYRSIYFDTGYEGRLYASFKTTYPYISTAYLNYAGYRGEEDIYSDLRVYNVYGYGSLFNPQYPITYYCYGTIYGSGDPYNETNITEYIELTRYYVDDEYDKIAWSGINRSGFLFENIFPYTRIEAWMNDEGNVILTYLYDDPNKEIPQSYLLKVLLYNRSSNEWFRETTIPSKDEAVILPKIVDIGDNVIFVWTTVPFDVISNSSRDTLLKNILENSRVKAGIYNLKEHKWVKVWVLTDTKYVITYSLSRDNNSAYLLLTKVVGSIGNTTVVLLELYDVLSNEKIWSMTTYNVTNIIGFDAMNEVAVLETLNNEFLVITYNNGYPDIITIPKFKNSTISYISLQKDNEIIVVYRLSGGNDTTYYRIVTYRVYGSMLKQIDIIETILPLDLASYILKLRDKYLAILVGVDSAKLIIINSDGTYTLVKKWIINNILGAYIVYRNNILNIFILNINYGNITHPITGLYFTQLKLLPEPPTNLTISRLSPDNILLTWNPPIEPGDIGVKGYIVYRDNKPIAYLPPDQLGFNDIGIDPGSPHIYRVVAYNEVGESEAATVIVRGFTSLVIERTLYKIYRDEPFTLKTRLISMNGTPLPGYTITFYLFNGTHWIFLGENRTDDKGYAYLTMAYSGLSHTIIRAVFNGSALYEGSVSDKIVLEWFKKPVKIYLGLSTNETFINESIRVTIRLSTIDDKPVGNVSIYLYNGSNLLRIVDIDQDGCVEFDLYLSRPGIYNLTAYFNGTEFYDEAINNTLFIVKHVVELYFIDVEYRLIGNDTVLFILKVRLLIDNDPYPGQEILFYKKGSWIFIGSNTTDRNGEAVLYYIDELQTYYVFRANFTSTDPLIPSTYDLIDEVVKVSSENNTVGIGGQISSIEVQNITANTTYDTDNTGSDAIHDIENLPPMHEPPIYVLLVISMLLALYIVRKFKK